MRHVAAHCNTRLLPAIGDKLDLNLATPLAPLRAARGLVNIHTYISGPLNLSGQRCECRCCACATQWPVNCQCNCHLRAEVNCLQLQIHLHLRTRRALSMWPTGKCNKCVQQQQRQHEQQQLCKQTECVTHNLEAVKSLQSNALRNLANWQMAQTECVAVGGSLH